MPTNLYNENVDLQLSLGGRLKAERIRLGLSQDGLAHRASITGRSISAYELGKSTIRLEILYRLADAGVDIPYVLFGDGHEGSVEFDPDLFERVNRWADETCVDRKGNPIPQWERLQRVMRAYRWLASGKTKEEREDRFDQLPPSRAA